MITQVTTPPEQSGEQLRPPPASRLEELVFLFCAFWVLVGLCLDGWAHRHQPELESFFTPWHAVFYTGYIAGTAWLAFIVLRRRSTVRSLKAAIPDGYQLAVVGLGIFAVGGIGDGFWHTIFGVETGLDALLSPTHLVLLVGLFTSTTAPIRAAWRSVSSNSLDVSYQSFLPVTLSTATATVGVAFFFLYANGFNNWPMTRSYQPGSNDSLAAFGVYSTLASTVILMFPVMFLLRRWRPPWGTFLTVFSIVGFFMAGLDAFTSWWQVIAPITGGLVVDAVIVSQYPIGTKLERRIDTATARRSAVVGGLLTPLAMWSVAALSMHLAWGVEWPPELWSGAIVMASLVGIGLAMLSHPAPVPNNSSAGTP